MKYLYYYGGVYTKDGLFRAEVSRETDANIWIILGKSEQKISKKTYCAGSGWNTTYYYEETPKLLEEYNVSQTKRKFARTIESLSKITDISVMRKILDLDIVKELERGQ